MTSIFGYQIRYSEFYIDKSLLFYDAGLSFCFGVVAAA